MEAKQTGMRRVLWALALAGALASAGCGGGGTGTPTVLTPQAPQTVSGVVADGYLQGANVFLDKNGNKTWDDGEPKATTDANGAYTLEGVSAADKAAYPVVVQVPSTAIDKDTGAAVGGAGYVLTAPAGKPEFVSPVTTLVQNQIEANPALTVTAAESAVKTQMGITSSASLFDDFVKKKNDITDASAAAEYDKIHKVAQVVATAINNNMDAIKTAAPTVDLKDVIKIVVNEVMNQLTAIATTVPPKGTELDSTTKSSLVSAVSSNIPTTAGDITTAVSEVSAPRTVGTFEKIMLGDGFFSINGYMDYNTMRFEYGNVKFGTTAGTLTESRFNYLNGAWTTAANNDQQYFLTSNGWILSSDGAEMGTVAMNADNTATWTHKVTGEKMNVSVTITDVSGKLVAPFVMPGGVSVKTGTVFPAGSEAYRLTMTTLQDQYHIWVGTNGQNQVTYYDQQKMTSATVTTLADLLSVFADGTNNRLWLAPQISMQFTGTGTTGGVNFYTYPQTSTQPGVEPSFTKLALAGKWESKTVMGQNIVVVSVPFEYKVKFSNGGDDQTKDPIYAVIDGVVKQGGVQYGNTPKVERDYNFNKTAFDAILANFVTNTGTAAAKIASKKR